MIRRPPAPVLPALLHIPGVTTDNDVQKFMRAHGGDYGCTIIGQGIHSVIRVPLAFTGAYPRLENVTVDVRGLTLNDMPTSAAVSFVNPGASVSTGLHIISDVKGAVGLLELLTETGSGAPWPIDDGPANAASLSLHTGLVLAIANGGGIELRSDRKKGTSGWANHFRILGGRFSDYSKSGDVLGWLTDGEKGRADWSDRYEPRPALACMSHTADISQTHFDVYPGERDGKTPAVWIGGGGGRNPSRVSWDFGTAGYLESYRKDVARYPDWSVNNRPRPVVYGPGVGTASIATMNGFQCLHSPGLRIVNSSPDLSYYV